MRNWGCCLIIKKLVQSLHNVYDRGLKNNSKPCTQCAWKKKFNKTSKLAHYLFDKMFQSSINSKFPQNINSDLGQLPLVKSHPKFCKNISWEYRIWWSINTIVTLDIIFRQQGGDLSQVTFQKLLMNIKHSKPTLENWHILMYKTNSFLTHE